MISHIAVCLTFTWLIKNHIIGVFNNLSFHALCDHERTITKKLLQCLFAFYFYGVRHNFFLELLTALITTMLIFSCYPSKLKHFWVHRAFYILFGQPSPISSLKWNVLAFIPDVRRKHENFLKGTCSCIISAKLNVFGCTVRFRNFSVNHPLNNCVVHMVLRSWCQSRS